MRYRERGSWLKVTWLAKAEPGLKGRLTDSRAIT